MSAKTLIKKFADDELGNAIVDWVVLMAGMVLMAIAVGFTIAENIDTVADGTALEIDAMEANPKL
ncbi:hypothetical protein [Aliiroseovarius subalbicans]|uniref:hypothetical protein n=1 Tax=Aliiroseovarius subalbicans TaxID=2925840 RepID=UPI001F594C04|nr:hypothetical protein [Aliiroseovarius subalbicans]MCI2400375.1 hypothetical protein [Aliiroseovarius subalbicans]